MPPFLSNLSIPNRIEKGIIWTPDFDQLLILLLHDALKLKIRVRNIKKIRFIVNVFYKYTYINGCMGHV